MDTSRHTDTWKVIEKGFDPLRQGKVESLFSLGNGAGGHRAFFEEDYSGKGLHGCYLGGIYVPEQLPFRHHMVGLPDTYSRMPPIANWLGLHVAVEGEPLDLATAKVTAFQRTLDLDQGLLTRKFTARLPGGKILRVTATRFQSLADTELGVLKYVITPLNFAGSITLIPYLDLNAWNDPAGLEKYFWVEVETYVKRSHAHLVAETRHTEFQVCSSMKIKIFRKGEPVEFTAFRVQREKYVGCSVDVAVEEGETIELHKVCSNISTLQYPALGLLDRGKTKAKAAAMLGFEKLEKNHREAWKNKWSKADIRISGDPKAQQGIRFCIFHLLQAYHGQDERLSISPRGYTGEKSAGCTYWSAEAFCLPFVLAAMGKNAAKNLLLYRYRQLPEAIVNAARLGIGNGAALFPMVTINGEECHPDWEIAFEAIHRNGAIAFGIYDYLRYTGDDSFLAEYGLEMLIAISRFWAQRVHFAESRQAYLIHGVTGPNEYENNVDNNWYTNLLARWCLRYTVESIKQVSDSSPERLEEICNGCSLNVEEETKNWQAIATQLFLPYHEESGIFLQQEGYLDKPSSTLSDLGPDDLPLHEKWSWDRIMRSGFVQGADVLQGLFYFFEHFSADVIRRNFEFYESRTVHESTLSPGLHAILAARLGMKEKAYHYFMHSVRTDLDDLTGETDQGCHVTSMGASWMAVVMGFGGMRIMHDKLSFHPILPEKWDSYNFRLTFREWNIKVKVSRESVIISHDQELPLQVILYGEMLEVGRKLGIQRTSSVDGGGALAGKG